MSAKTLLAVLGLAVLIILPILILRNTNSQSKISSENIKQEKIETKGTSTPTKSQDDLSPAAKFQVEGNRFEILGTVDAMSGNSFTINGRIVMIDQSKVGSFEQKGTLTVGALVKAEGIVINGQNFAQEIKVGVENIGELRSGDDGNDNSGKNGGN